MEWPTDSDKCIRDGKAYLKCADGEWRDIREVDPHIAGYQIYYYDASLPSRPSPGDGIKWAERGGLIVPEGCA